MAGPLSGIKVVDLSRILAGPWSTQLLADLGADVIKVERPVTGDDTRGWGPPFLDCEDSGTVGEAAYFLSANRGKRSITVDVSTSDGQEIVRQLAAKADVFIENYKVGDMQRYGLDYSSLNTINPGLVYCSITGFGQSGPYRHRAGYDFVIQAMGGLMSITGESDDRGGGPQKCGVPIADLMTGMYSTVAMLSALLERKSSGKGQHVDMSLLDTQVAWLANQASNYLVSGKHPKRWGNAHPNLAPYQSFTASDGEFILAVGNDRQFVALCSAIGLNEMAHDERFETNAARLSNREALSAMLSAAFAKDATEEWLSRLEQVGVPAGPVLTIPQALNDEHVLARGMVFSLPHSRGAAVPQIANPIKFSRTEIDYRRAAPSLGEHTEAILSEELGLSLQSIQALKAAGTI